MPLGFGRSILAYKAPAGGGGGGSERYGTLWTWGQASASLGLGSTANASQQNTPQQVGTDTDWMASSLMIGNGGCVCIKQNGDLYTWGANGNGSCANGGNSRIDEPYDINANPLNPSRTWTKTSTARNSLYAITSTNELWSAGENGRGQLGIGNNTLQTSNYSFNQVSSGVSWAQVADGGQHVIALDTDGYIYTWGWGLNGRLGSGSTSDVYTPTKRTPTYTYTWVDASSTTTYAIRSDGTMWATGRNSYCELGDNNVGVQSTVFKQVGTDTDWKYVRAGSNYAIAIKTDGSLWGWGRNWGNNFGFSAITASPVTVPTQLGTGTNWGSNPPSIITTDGADIIYGSGTFLINDSDELYVCGEGSNGQMGDGTATDIATLTQLSGTWYAGHTGGLGNSAGIQAP